MWMYHPWSCCLCPPKAEERPAKLQERGWKEKHPAANAVRDLYEAETQRRRSSAERDERRDNEALHDHESALAEEIYQRSSNEETRQASAERARPHSSGDESQGRSGPAAQQRWQRKSEEDAREKPVLASRPRRASCDGSMGSRGSRGSHGSVGSAASVASLLTSPQPSNKPRALPRGGRIGVVPVVYE